MGLHDATEQTGSFTYICNARTLFNPNAELYFIYKKNMIVN